MIGHSLEIVNSGMFGFSHGNMFVFFEWKFDMFLKAVRHEIVWNSRVAVLVVKILQNGWTD